MARNNRIVIYCRLAYLNCWKPIQMYGKQIYSLVALVNKDDQQTINLIRSTIESVRQQSVSKWGNSLLSGNKSPLHDGDIEKPDNPIFKNCYYLNAKCKEPPQIVDQNVQPITNPDLVYSGCFANISLLFYPFNYGANKGIGVWLGNIQLVKSGGRIVSRITAQEDFQPVSYTELLEVN